MLTPLIGLNTDELRTLLKQEGEPAYRAKQLAEWLYRRGAHRFDEMTNLPEALRARLKERYRVGRGHPVTERVSKDGTVKLLLETCDSARVETVGLPYHDRTSCCVSTQVGCPIGCAFCATGLSGFTRNLNAGEIVDQVLTVQEAMGQKRVDHVTFMGMGEPLLNYDATLKAVRLLNEEVGIAMRNLTVSTVGHVPGIRALAREKLQLTLAISLHAPTDELRRRLVPTMSKWRVADIIDACRNYVEQTGRRVTFEYCLLAGINDSQELAHELARVLRGLNCHVNLIPFNTVRAVDFRRPRTERVREFRTILDGRGIQATQRLQRGSGIDAACGQLRRSAITDNA